MKKLLINQQNYQQLKDYHKGTKPSKILLSFQFLQLVSTYSGVRLWYLGWCKKNMVNQEPILKGAIKWDLQ